MFKSTAKTRPAGPVLASAPRKSTTAALLALAVLTAMIVVGIYVYVVFEIAATATP